MARLVRLMRVCFRYFEPVALLRCSCWELAACRSWEYVVCAGANLVGRERRSKSRVDGRLVSEQAQRVEHLCSPTRESLRRASAAIPMGHLAHLGAPGQRGHAQPYLLPAHCQSLISRRLAARLCDIAALFAPTCPPGANLRSAAEPARRSLQLERRIHFLAHSERRQALPYCCWRERLHRLGRDQPVLVAAQCASNAELEFVRAAGLIIGGRW